VGRTSVTERRRQAGPMAPSVCTGVCKSPAPGPSQVGLDRGFKTGAGQYVPLGHTVHRPSPLNSIFLFF
jgi:hypothetical protein